MSVKQIIERKLESLSEDRQNEVLNFVASLLQKSADEEVKKENAEWNQFSLEQAMNGLENDGLPEYTLQDLKEKWQ